MSEMIGGIVVSCGECFASGVPFVHRYVWWRNSYGARVRVFCHVCGCITDKIERKGIIETKILETKAEIRYPRPVEGDLPF